MKFRKYILSAFILLITHTVYSKDKLITWDAPQGVELNSDFSMRVRLKDKKWHETPTYLIKVAKVTDAGHSIEKASLSYFDFTGEVQVSVTYNKGNIDAVQVRPLSYGIVPKVNGNTLTFTLNEPCNLSVEVNGDIFHNLHLFANPIDEYVPNRKDPDLIYFAPGLHQLEGEELMVTSGKTVYVSGGAVVKGRLHVENAENVKILGRGMIDQNVRLGINISNSKNVCIEGIIASQCATGGSDNVTIRNVKSISYFNWGDGMNVFASNNVLFDGVFCRNSDDCTTVYATRKGYKGGCKNITMQNSILWADVAHPIFIGLHSETERFEVLENLNYVNIDILDHAERQLDYQGCLAINAGDNNLVSNVRFENIRIENIRKGQLLNLRVSYNRKYCTAPGLGIENVLFKNISYTGNNADTSIIAGYNKERKVKNIRFENLEINGKVIYDNMPEKPKWYKTGDMAKFFIGEHVENITFSE